MAGSHQVLEEFPPLQTNLLKNTSAQRERDVWRAPEMVLQRQDPTPGQRHLQLASARCLRETERPLQPREFDSKGTLDLGKCRQVDKPGAGWVCVTIRGPPPKRLSSFWCPSKTCLKWVHSKNKNASEPTKICKGISRKAILLRFRVNLPGSRCQPCHCEVF